MSAKTHNPVYTWLVLLAMTVGMIAAERAGFGRVGAVVILGGAMLVKAGLIALEFMHLRSENRRLILLVGAGLLVTGAVLFGLISIDGIRAGELRS